MIRISFCSWLAREDLLNHERQQLIGQEEDCKHLIGEMSDDIITLSVIAVE